MRSHITEADLGIIIAPHVNGPDHGWYFREATYQDVNDWHGPQATKEAAQAAAIRWLTQQSTQSTTKEAQYAIYSTRVGSRRCARH